MRTLKMSWLLFAYLFNILSLMHVVYVTCQCLESERYHLLQLKAGLKVLDDGQYSDEKLVTWNNQSWDCCLWSGVGCSEDGKVVRLDLSGQGITEGVNDSSSLFSLKYLERLNLAENRFNSTFPAKFDELSHLNYLNLSYSGFLSQIPIGISSLKNLQTLDISSDIIYYSPYFGYRSSSLKLENPNLDTLIRNLSNLHELLLDGVHISAKDDNWGRAISSSLPNLQVLSLSGCDLKGSIDLSLLKLRHLSEIRLADNNDLNGIFPQEIFHLPSLRAIDLRFNGNLKGSFPEISVNNSLEELVLSYTNFSGGLPYAIGNLKSLFRLEISNCRFSGALPKSLSNLTKLTYLDLSWNIFVGSIPSFTWLSNLTYLNLFINQFLNGSIHSTDWEGLTKLEYLDLGFNSLSGSIPVSVFRAPSLKTLDLRENQFNDISNEQLNMSSSSSQLSFITLSSNVINGPFPHFVLQFTQLSNLDLSGNNFNGPLSDFSFMQKLESLSSLDISYNNFNGPLPDFSSLQKLETLHLSSNKFNGPFSNSLLMCENLSSLDLSHNSFSGPLPDFSSLQKLKSLHLSFNKFNGLFPNSLFKCEKLLYLLLSYNNFSGIFYSSMINQFQLLLSIDLSYSGFSFVDDSIDVPSSLPSLSSVRLGSCGLRSFPGFLRNSSNLRSLDLSMNQISGEIPNWIWEVKGFYFLLNLSHNFLEDMGRPIVPTVPYISYLDLHSNRLRGELSFFPTHASYLDYSMNNFSSNIPHLIHSSSAYFLSLSNNNFNGSIPESFCNISGIQVLNLSNNSLTGSIPQCISILMGRLQVLNLGMNNLNGTISDVLFQAGCQLETLDLNGNHLSGKVPESLENCKRLQVLNLGNNEIDDTFPCWLKEISNLTVLVLRSNNFHGDMGCPETKATSHMLQIVDLSSNSFSGKLSVEWFLSWKGMTVVTRSKSILNAGLYYQDMVTVNLKGNELKLEKILNIFTCIDLSSNKFEGNIPQELGDLKALLGLNMSGNNFRGRIPASLGSLKQLESLDLSKNKLSGAIPRQLADLNFLQVLNLSFNQLEGRIPRGSQFDNLCEDSFLGNKGLVGPQVNRKCKDNGKTVSSPPTSSHDNNTSSMKSEVRWELIGAEVGFTCGLGLVVGSFLFWQRWRKWYFDRIDQVLLKIQCHWNQRKPNQLRRRVGK